MRSMRMRLHLRTTRNRSPSLPAIPAAAAPIARFCGEIILPSTPPELFDAARRVGDRCAFCAAVTWSAPNREVDDVPEAVMAVPSQPIIGEKNANALPAPATQDPSVIVSPERFMTYARASTDATVRIAHLSRSSVSP